jgi:HD-GYP domain-containing protein (c-di-GMP phosphodiesterase class II)
MELADHCLQMSLLGMALAIEMGMSEAEICLVGLSGLLHDWGMTRVPEAIVSAKRVLSRVEFLEIQKHPMYTLDLLRSISGIPARVPLICFQVHEQPNGRGYPRGRQHENIHPAARILHVADVYLALTSQRPFRPPVTPAAAMRCLLVQARDNAVDPAAVASLLNVMSLFPIGSYVLLSDGSMARVVRRNGDKYTTPIVEIVQDAAGAPVAADAQDSQIIDPSERGLTVVRGLPTPGRDEVELTPEVLNLKRS